MLYLVRNIYFYTGVVKNAGQATFKMYDQGYNEADAEDVSENFPKEKK